jgi:adenosine deaminase
MLRRWTLALTTVITLALGAAAPAAQAGPLDLLDGLRTARYLDTVRTDPVKLHALLAQLPKGGDLHNHLSGAVTTETLIRLASEDGLCIVLSTMTAQNPPAPATCPPGQRKIAESSSDPAFYRQILMAWSMEGFDPSAGETGHDHFFATFGKFGAASARKGDLLAEVATINADQNVLYLETLASRQGSQVRALATQVGFDPNFAAMRAKLIAGGMAQIVTGAIAETNADYDRRDALLGCKTATPQPGCAVDVRFDYQVSRAVDPATVFTNILLGFELQKADPRYVGLNLVQPEDDPVALRDYTLQMNMIKYLRTVYPGTHVTLHAGELAPGLAPPADLTFHIRQAVEIAGAERIGHAVDLVHETNYPQLLREMASRHVLVESPLTSNAQILGISGAAHPFPRYRAAGVPVALATDDPGVSRIDITHEFEFATTTYKLRYPDLRTLTRASLEHAFLPGTSLWRAPDRFQRRLACEFDTPGAASLSAPCRALLASSEKARAQWEQERRLRVFEHYAAGLALPARRAAAARR